ncbi:MAG: hypothetical protein Q9195_007353 [Heterodermia aff. obscurata]
MTPSVKDQSASAQQGALAPSQHEEIVLLPDLFVSFHSQEPRFHPKYQQVKQESESWIANLCHYDEKSYKKHVKADFPSFIAMWVHDVEPEDFRTIVDWSNWVFDFDDMFDEGFLQKNPEQAKIQVTNLKNVMSDNGSNPMMTSEDPLLSVFASVWHRLAKRSSEGVRKRFIEASIDYVDGVLRQVEVVASAVRPDEEEYIAMRRRSIGVTPCLVFIEYCYGLDLPDEVAQDAAIQQLQKLAKELVVIQNDAVSFLKELADGIDQNLVAFYGRRGLPPQEAYDRIDILYKARCRQWYLAWADVPQWGEAIDKQVQKYIHSMQALVAANLHWSFRSTRYFGEKTDQVRQTRAITVSSEQLLKNGLAQPRKKSDG